jgi:hypothetical protein
MGLPLLYVLPQTPDDWSAWSFNHAAIHYTVVDAIQTQKNKNLSQFLLDPISDVGYWLYLHQDSHNQINAALGTQGNNLLSYDWDDPDQVQEWLNLNGSEHQNWNTILKV